MCQEYGSTAVASAMPPPRLERWWAYDIAWTVVAATVAFSIGQVKRCVGMRVSVAVCVRGATTHTQACDRHAVAGPMDI